MDITVKRHTEKSQVELTVSVPAASFKPYVDRAAKQLSRSKQLKGFRPGKAPTEVVISAFGKDRVLSAAIDKALPKFFVEAILEHDLEAINRPATTIDKADLVEGFAFTATVDVLPEVELADPTTLTVERAEPDISDEQVERELKTLAKMRSKAIDLLRPAKKGDTVVVDFTITLNGAVMKDGESKNHPITLGEGYFVPEFEQKLLGLNTGDSREFDFKYPDNHPNKELGGKQAHAVIKAHKVQKLVAPEINDEFAAGLGTFTSLSGLKSELKKNLITEHQQQEKDRLRGELAKKLAEASTIGHIPEVLIERDIEQRLHELRHMLGAQQKTLESYLEDQKKTIKDLHDELKKPAEQAARINLVMRTFVKEQAIEVSDEEVAEKAQEFLAKYNSAKEAKQEIDEDELKQNVSASLKNQKALEKLEELAQITVKGSKEAFKEKAKRVS